MVKKEFVKGDIFDNFVLWERASKICQIEEDKDVTRNYIEGLLKENKSGVYFSITLKLLEEMNFIIVDRTRIPHLYKIKSKQLSTELLEHGYISDLFESVVKIKSPKSYKY